MKCSSVSLRFAKISKDGSDSPPRPKHLFGFGLQLGCSFRCVACSPYPNSLKRWSERGDLNSRPPVPQTGALTELRYAPTLETND